MNDIDLEDADETIYGCPRRRWSRCEKGRWVMGCIYKRGKTYWIKYSRNGRPYFESSGSKKHEDAKRLLRLREGDIARVGCP